MPKGRAARMLGAVLLVALMTGPSIAQTGGMPAEIERRLAELGAVVNPPETAKLYRPLQQTEPYAGVKVTRDIKYGAHERHVLDVFASEAPAAGPRRRRPVRPFAAPFARRTRSRP